MGFPNTGLTLAYNCKEIAGIYLRIAQGSFLATPTFLPTKTATAGLIENDYCGYKAATSCLAAAAGYLKPGSHSGPQVQTAFLLATHPTLHLTLYMRPEAFKPSVHTHARTLNLRAQCFALTPRPASAKNISNPETREPPHSYH